MAKPKTVIDLLAEQPGDELRRMRDVAKSELTRLQNEVARLTVEAQQLDAALAAQRRSEQPSRGSLTREMVLEVAQTIEPPFSPADVVRSIAADLGIEATANTVRNHMSRLMESGQLVRAAEGYWVRGVTPAASQAASDADFGGAGANDDIPF